MAVATPAFAGSGTPAKPIDVAARPIAQFCIGRDDTAFGPLEFAGGLEMTAASPDFGGLSAFRFLEPGSDFIGVADTGFWFSGTVERDAEGRPSGISRFRMQRMEDKAGRPLDDKREGDAEGLAVRDGIATVGFEHHHRVEQYRIGPDGMGRPLRRLDFLVPAHELRRNRGFETVAHDASGRLVVVSERSLDRQGNVLAAIVEGPRTGVFTVRRDGDFDITDGAFLPGGDLVLLERGVSLLGGVRMRLRRIAGAGIAPGALADGPVLMEADMTCWIDNMEGLDVWRRADGALMVSLVSDDNHSFLQRNLYLEFVLRGE